jgi:hypothetical protein
MYENKNCFRSIDGFYLKDDAEGKDERFVFDDWRELYIL